MKKDVPSGALALADRAGACLSCACAVHCLVTPFLIAFLPFLGLRFLADEAFETVLVTTAVGVASGSFCWGYRRHRRRSLLLILVIALSLILAGRCLVQAPYESALVAAGGLALAGGHLLNRRLCRACAECQAREAS